MNRYRDDDWAWAIEMTSDARVTLEASVDGVMYLYRLKGDWCNASIFFGPDGIAVMGDWAPDAVSRLARDRAWFGRVRTPEELGAAFLIPGWVSELAARTVEAWITDVAAAYGGSDTGLVSRLRELPGEIRDGWVDERGIAEFIEDACDDHGVPLAGPVIHHGYHLQDLARLVAIQSAFMRDIAPILEGRP